MKKIFIIAIFTLIIAVVGIYFIFIFPKNSSKKKKEEKIVYTDALTDTNIVLDNEAIVEFGRIKHLSDFLSLTTGTLNDEEITYDDLGEVTVNFSYNLDNKKQYRFVKFNIVDTTKPYISVPSIKTISVNTGIDFIYDFFCADNHDRNVERYLEGDFEIGKVGSYYVKYVAKDSSGNISDKEMTLNIVENIPKSSGNSSSSSHINYLDYQDLYNQYKTENTKIGIDISRWQGDVDFAKLKENNVEFIMIRLGGQEGVDGEYYIDSKFERNMEEAKKYGFAVGVYFYSYAYTEEEAINQAKYVIDNLKGYDLKLPIVFDWECWNKFNKLNVSLYDITKVQNAYLDYVSKKGYKAARYGSKNALVYEWQDSHHLTWLAHYISETNYEGEYFMWQRCDTGRVAGINGAVDVDILYLDKFDL